MFIRDRAALERRIAALDDVRDPDGRFRIEDVFCAGEAWRDAVRRLISDSCAVVMDLRSFNHKNEGCAFELQALLDMVPLTRIFLFVDNTTDLDFLRKTLVKGWQQLDTASPNQHAPKPALRLLNVGGSESAAINQLLEETNALGTVMQPPVRENQLATA